MLTILAVILSLILPACPTEDSTQCTWDASAQGNGQGTSFVAIDDTTILPLP